jgi:hypothetical protein
MTPTIPLKKTIATMFQLDPPPSNLIPSPIFYYQPKHIFVMDRTFSQALAIALHLFFGELSRMVYEHFSRCFIPKDPSSWFSKLFHVINVVAHGDIPRSMALMLGTNKLLTMTKHIGGLHPIVINEVFLQLISRSIIL